MLIHAVYLINCASEDAEIRQKSHASLIQSLTRRRRDRRRPASCCTPGSAKQGDVGKAIKRAGKVIAEALSETEGCELHLEDTAGTGGTLGRSFEELAALLEAAGGDERLGVCLDSCHLLASGYDIRTVDGLTEMLDEFDAVVGLERLRSLHLNDSQTPLGSNRDRHADIGEGELGETRLRGVPLRAAIRHTAVRARDPRARIAGPDHGGARALRQAAQARPQAGTRAAAAKAAGRHERDRRDPPRRRAGRVRDHRRPGQADDAALAVPAGRARAARLPGGRRRRRGLDGRDSCASTRAR